MDPDTDPGGSQTCGSSGSGSPTLHISRYTVEAASCLMRVNAEIKVGDHAGHILAVQVVVGHVDIPHTPSNKHTGSEQNLPAVLRILIRCGKNSKPGSGMGKIRIRGKHPGFETLLIRQIRGSVIRIRII